MHLIIVKNAEEIAKFVSKLLIEQVQKDLKVVLGLATGSTPLPIYRLLVEDHQQNKTNWSDVTTFNLDEYVGLKTTDPQSYHYFMNEHLFDYLNLNSKNINVPKGTGNPDQNAKDYEELLAEKGPINYQLLGLGENGHIGFNEPGSEIDSVTRVVDLTTETIKANSRFFEEEANVPKQAVTMGIKTILNADNIVLVANGSNKAKAIEMLFYSPISSEWPCTYLQTHKNVTVVIDEEAAGLLQKTKKEKETNA